MMTYHERYGTIPKSTLAVIRKANVSQSDWDMMLARWGYEWDSPNLPFEAIEDHIVSHMVNGLYTYPMYG